MDLGEALQQIESIHHRLARSSTYRGYHPLAMALSGLVGLVAGFLQSWFVNEADSGGFLLYWVLTGSLCAFLAGGKTLFDYVRTEDVFARRRTRTVVCQFFPCLLAGAIITLAIATSGFADTGIPWLPGLWAFLYALGIVASLPFLPERTSLIAVWYFAWGSVLLRLLPPALPPGWSVGLPFGGGQLLGALVLLQARSREESR